MPRAKRYLATDGKLVLSLEQEGKWLIVTAPFERGVNTQARTISEAFEMAHDAIKTLRMGRRRLEANRPKILTAGRQAASYRR